MKRCLPACILMVALFAGLAATPALACPFCSAVSQTFSEEMNSMDAVVIGRLVKLPVVGNGASSDDVPKAAFKVVQSIKGASAYEGKQIETIYFGDAKSGTEFLIMGVDPPKIMWSTPLPLTDRARGYLAALPTLPKDGPDRLKFFQKFLEDRDEMLARDAYDEFAKAPYDQVKALRPEMQHEQLVAWIKDPDIPASRRRLYLTMLGVCGSEADLPMLESMLKSTDRGQKAGLDALIGCYLTLKGAGGMPLVEELFLKNKEAEYADTYAAIMALRFHGGEDDIVPRKRILQGLHYMLERPQLADLVIPDLAKWEDWTVMDRLVELFKESDDKTSWVRVPVINYLRACPLPKAKQYIGELEKIDPGAVKRAKTFFPFGPSSDKSSGDAQTSQIRAAAPAIVHTSAAPTSPRQTAASRANSWAVWGVSLAGGAVVLLALAAPFRRG